MARNDVIVNVASVLLYLRGRRYMPDCQVMAAHLGMSLRNLYRYLDALEQAGYVMPRRHRDDIEAAS